MMGAVGLKLFLEYNFSSQVVIFSSLSPGKEFFFEGGWRLRIFENFSSNSLIFYPPSPAQPTKNVEVSWWLLFHQKYFPPSQGVHPQTRRNTSTFPLLCTGKKNVPDMYFKTINSSKFFFHNLKKVPVRRTGAYRHKKALVIFILSIEI